MIIDDYIDIVEDTARAISSKYQTHKAEEIMSDITVLWDKIVKNYQPDKYDLSQTIWLVWVSYSRREHSRETKHSDKMCRVSKNDLNIIYHWIDPNSGKDIDILIDQEHAETIVSILSRELPEETNFCLSNINRVWKVGEEMQRRRFNQCLKRMKEFCDGRGYER